MKVFIVWLEYQADTPEILGVFAEKLDADTLAADQQQKLLDAGDIIEDVNDAEGNLDWTVTIHLDEHEVI